MSWYRHPRPRRSRDWGPPPAPLGPDADDLIRQLGADWDRVAGRSDRLREDAALERRYGPDPFGLRDLPPVPDLIRGVDLVGLPIDRVVSLFRRLNLADAD